ncbi:MAG: hypothetical protein BroJett040_07010 [Oligoflexia bacterium]|nr:MAG: hypothetical protein BroJett040_07010 [Oligoflexia bacterium]
MKEIEEVRIAYSFTPGQIPDLDPAEISMIDQALLIDNLYSHLIEYDENGKLQPGIADYFEIKDDTIIFHFSKKVKTRSGHFIDADDAAASIRRLIKLDSATHAELTNILCSKDEITDVFKDCPAIKSQNNQLILSVRDIRYRSYLLEALAADDMVIVPISAINPQSLKIQNYSETSGPYSIDYVKDERLVFIQNPVHYNLRGNSPRAVTLISTDKTSIDDLFLSNKVDILSTLNNPSSEMVQRFKEQVPSTNINKTLSIKLYYIQFSPSAQKKFSRAQRSRIANQFKKVMPAAYPLPLFAEPTSTFFLDNSIGMLSQEQMREVERLNSIEEDVLYEKPTFYLYKSRAKIFNVFKQIKEINPIETDDVPFFTAPEKRLDIFLATTDTSYEESYALLGYNFTMGTFGVNKQESIPWMAEYLKTENSVDRVKLINTLHFNALKSGVLFPLYKAPYTSVGRNGFELPLNPMFASSHFWKIRKHE